MRPLLLVTALLAACTPRITANGSVEPSPLTMDTDDIPAEVPTPWTVAIDPAAPLWSDDLRCVVTGPDAGTPVPIAWTVNGQPWVGGTETRARVGDTIPHLMQAGGQRWSCSVTSSDGAPLVASPVRIEPPLPMAELPPGTFTGAAFSMAILEDFGPRVPQWDVTLTRAYLLGRFETTIGAFQAWMGYVTNPDLYPDSYPVARLTIHEAMAFTNVLSAADGLAPCFTCTGARSAVACVRPEDPYACEGYRLPVQVEWEYAYYEAGAHFDMLPAGGNWTPDESLDEASMFYDAPVWGPNAPPNSTIADQCLYLYNARVVGGVEKQAVGQRIPTRHGLHDLCGSVSEFVLDRSHQSFSKVDPYSGSFILDLAIGAHASSSPYSMSYPFVYAGSDPSSNTGFRVARTNTPVAPGGTP